LPSTPHAVLYVDDEPANLSTFKYCFGERYEVLVAQTGETRSRPLASRPVRHDRGPAHAPA